MRIRHSGNEGGTSLVVVLIFMSVFGLIIAALLTETHASFGFTNTVSGHEKNVYAADAGVSFGIQQLHQNNELCPTAGVGGPAIPNLAVPQPGGKNLPVSIICDDTSGSTLGGNGYAMITTSPEEDSLELAGAAGKNEDKLIGGPVYVGGGVDWGTDMKVTGGNFYQRKPPAPATACLKPPPSIGPDKKLELDRPPYGYYCTTMAPPDPAHIPPVEPGPLAQSPTGDNNPMCRTFLPGLYTAKPELVDNNYFVSGVYYFRFNDEIKVVNQRVFGGQPGLGETPQLKSVPSCATDDPSGAIGTGVEWIFGGGSSLLVDNPEGRLELFRREGEPAPATNRLSIVAVPDDSATNGPWSTAGWLPNSLANTSRFVDLGEGTTPGMAIHGLIYSPNQWIALRATNTELAQTLGGIVAYKITLMASAKVTGFEVSVEPGAPGDRHILITACAPAVTAPVPGNCPSAPGSERPVMSTAIVTVANDAATTTNVQSWRTRGPSD